MFRDGKHGAALRHLPSGYPRSTGPGCGARCSRPASPVDCGSSPPQLDAFEEADGWRYTAFATDSRVGQLARLDARHRAHAWVEDRIRCAKDTGLGHFPRSFAINQAWLAVVMLAVDLFAWTQHLLLHGHLAKAEPKTLRYRLLHVAARLTRGQRRLWLRIQKAWPWACDLTTSRPPSRATPVPAG